MAERPNTDERRREKRLSFTGECRVEIRSPAWGRLPEALNARTINLTEHGVRLDFAEFPFSRFAKWQQWIEGGNTVGVAISLLNSGKPVELTGDIVWLQFEHSGPPERGTCMVGVLLSLLGRESSEAVRTMMREIRPGGA
ncbi:PilZ domain-containing protein [Candidatus Poribacteria bacterium]|nr:PilZ domain-containing protein [Candidatus Poribacteria bacterium]